MFTRKEKPTAAPASVPTGPTRKWSNLDAWFQPISMDVKEFRYTVKPHMQDEGGVRATCRFQGISRTPGFEGVLVLGDIESCESREDIPGMLTDRWKKVPDLVNGYGYLVNRDKESIDESFFGFTLFCRPLAFVSIIDMFSRGIPSARNGVQLDAHLVHPDHFKQPNYWDTDWRSDTWQVSHWEAVDGVIADGYIPQ